MNWPWHHKHLQRQVWLLHHGGTWSLRALFCHLGVCVVDSVRDQLTCRLLTLTVTCRAPAGVRDIMSSFGGYYTRQEQEDAMTARIDNPNRVGSGFINLGPMQRQPPASSTNWQTGSLLGGGGGGVGAPAPPGVSDIWNNTPQLPPPPRAPQQPAPPLGAPPGMAGRYGSADPTGMGLGFQNLNMDSAAPSAAMQGQPYRVGLGVGHYGMGLGDVHGHVVPPPPADPAPLLMNLLHTPAPTAPSAGLAAGFAMGNGGQPTSQPFANPPMPQAPPVQLQGNGMHPSPFSPGSFAPSVAQAPRQPPAGPPRVLSSAADYAAAAQIYKPPVPARNASVATVSVSRQPEASKAQPAQTTKEEWECPRCTFLNNIALRECEMCAFERTGREEAPASRSEDDGWRPASSAVRRPASVPANPALPGKSKAQSKNEKRRAKKRGDH